MQRLAFARVLRIVEERLSNQVVEVLLEGTGERAKAIHYAARDVSCQSGSRVLVNTTAVRLGLGTGGYHIVVAVLEEEMEGKRTEREYASSVWGHVMKLRYSPLQLAVDTVEEQASPWHSCFTDSGSAQHLEQTPVLIGELHSLLPAVCLAVKREQPGLRIVYVMPDGASLPIGFSRHVEELRRLHLLDATVTTGHAWGGDLEAVNLYTGLLAARHVAHADLIVCLLGPGVVGTGTRLGFSGMQLAEVVHAVSLLQGVPLFLPRISFGDPRPRHFGLSHHTLTLLSQFLLVSVLLPIPRFGAMEQDGLLDQQVKTAGLGNRHLLLRPEAASTAAIQALQRDYPLALDSMGRSFDKDPAPFQTAVTGAWLALRMIQVGSAATQFSADVDLSASVPGDRLARWYYEQLIDAR